MTDEQIVRALECCGNMKECKKECPLGDVGGIDKCIHTLMLDALELIKRQQAEIEGLEADYENVYKQATSDILASIADAGTSCEWYLDKHRAEAVREFAKRFEKNIKDIQVTLGQTWEIQCALEKTITEMTEKEGGKG